MNNELDEILPSSHQKTFHIRFTQQLKEEKNFWLWENFMQSQENQNRFPTLIIAIGAVIVTVFVVMAILAMFFFSRSGYGYGYPYGWGMMGGFGFPMMLIMIPVMLTVFVIVAYVIYRGVRWGWGNGCGGRRERYYPENERESALELLKRRYVRGEVSKEQFEQMKKDLIG